MGYFLYVPYSVPWFKIPHKPPAGSLKVLHAPARWGGIRRASKTKINNLGTNEYPSNPPFSKKYLAGVIHMELLAGTIDFKKIENLEFLKKVLNSGTLVENSFK